MKNIIILSSCAALLSLSTLALADGQVCVKNLSGAVIRACDVYNPTECKTITLLLKRKLDFKNVKIEARNISIKDDIVPLWDTIPGAENIELLSGETVVVTGTLLHELDEDGNYIGPTKMKVSEPQPNTCN